MTDERDNPTDDLLSADLDGQTSTAEHDRIEADAGLRARRSELRQASEVAGQRPSPLDPAQIDAAIERALSASHGAKFDEPAPPLAPPVRLAGQRRRAPTPWLVAAAVVLLAAIGIGLIIKAPSSQRKDTAASTQHTSGQAKSKSADASTAAPSTTAPGTASAPGRASATGFIGDFSTTAALRDALRTSLPAPRRESAVARSASSFSGQADRCGAVLEARDSRLKRANRRSVAASIAGEPVLVFEYRAQAVGSNRTTTRVIAVGTAACDERINFER